jgi:hypothetical protein
METEEKEVKGCTFQQIEVMEHDVLEEGWEMVIEVEHSDHDVCDGLEKSSEALAYDAGTPDHLSGYAQAFE